MQPPCPHPLQPLTIRRTVGPSRAARPQALLHQVILKVPSAFIHLKRTWDTSSRLGIFSDLVSCLACNLVSCAGQSTVTHLAILPLGWIWAGPCSRRLGSGICCPCCMQTATVIQARGAHRYWASHPGPHRGRSHPAPLGLCHGLPCSAVTGLVLCRSSLFPTCP